MVDKDVLREKVETFNMLYRGKVQLESMTVFEQVPIKSIDESHASYVERMSGSEYRPMPYSVKATEISLKD